MLIGKFPRRLGVIALAAVLVSCSLKKKLTPPDGGSNSPEKFSGEILPTVQMVFQDYAAPAVPTNQYGDSYPSHYQTSGGPGGAEGGTAVISVDTSCGTSLWKNCLLLDVTGALYAQYNPYSSAGRGFAREYSKNPSGWQYNKYNRFSFWIKRPPTAQALLTDGRTNGNVGTYVKQITNVDNTSDERGGHHYYHNINLANNGQWIQVILNMHPNHYRGQTAGEDPGYVPYPTATNGPNGGGDPAETYNYFDTMTRFYIQDNSVASGQYRLANMAFYRQEGENDDQVYGITGTYDPSTNRVSVSWSRPTDENDINHEVRYAFSSILAGGWQSGTPAPNGTITPPGYQGYNQMVYETTALGLRGQSILYVAIKPQFKSDGRTPQTSFSQIAIPLTLK